MVTSFYLVRVTGFEPAAPRLRRQSGAQRAPAQEQDYFFHTLS